MNFSAANQSTSFVTLIIVGSERENEFEANKSETVYYILFHFTAAALFKVLLSRCREV